VQLAPAIHKVRRKARHSEGDEARALKLCAFLWRHERVWVAISFGGRIIAHVKGDPANNRTLVIFGNDVPYGSYDDAVSKKSGGKHYGPVYFLKFIDTAVVVDNWYDTWGTAANPIAGNWSGTARTARQFLNTTTGALYTGPSVLPQKKYLTRALSFNQDSNVLATLIYDRVLSYDACTMTASSQAMTNTLAATRYISSGDPGLQIFVEADTVHNATAANLTVLTYVNQAGTGGNVVPTTPTLTKTVSIAAPTSTLGARQTFPKGQIYLNLALGDLGVRSITDYTWSAAPTGTNSFVLQFPLMLSADVVINGNSSDYEFLSGLEAINKRIYDDACLSVMTCSRSTATPTFLNGMMEFGST
jgi:hypothetical protein